MSPAQSYFDGVARGYREKSRAGIWKAVRAWEASRLSRLLPTRLGHVLELGCGAAHYGEWLVDKGATSLTCLDMSSKMLDEVRVPCRKILADMETFRESRAYDLVWCAGALEFTRSPLLVVKNVASMLKPGGSFVALVPSRTLLGKRYEAFHASHDLAVHLFDVPTLRTWARKAGLELVDDLPVFPFNIAVRMEKRA